jgi:hypothetical protein
MQLQNFSGPKIRSLDRYKYPKKYFFEFGGLCTDTKCEKVVLFGFSTGNKSEKLKCYTTNILNSPLVPVLNPKSTTFSHLVPVQRSPNSKKYFFDICIGPNTLFLDLKKFGAAFGTLYYLQNFFLQTKIIPGTKHGVFRYVTWCTMVGLV